MDKALGLISSTEKNSKQGNNKQKHSRELTSVEGAALQLFSFHVSFTQVKSVFLSNMSCSLFELLHYAVFVMN